MLFSNPSRCGGVLLAVVLGACTAACSGSDAGTVAESGDAGSPDPGNPSAGAPTTAGNSLPPGSGGAGPGAVAPIPGGSMSGGSPAGGPSGEAGAVNGAGGSPSGEGGAFDGRAGALNDDAGAGLGGGTDIDPGGVVAAGGATASGGAAGAGPFAAGAAGMAGDTSAEAGASSGVGGATADPGSEFCDDPLMTGDTARLAVTESINLYTVEGSSAGEMRASLDLNGPGGYDGQTDWYIQWGYRSCSADGVDVSLDIVYTMPEWDEPASASPELADQWFSFVDLLWCHEFGHTANGLWAANEVLDTLVEALLQDCNNGWSSAQGEVQDILSQANAMDIMYDDETNHGATQGVQFP